MSNRLEWAMVGAIVVAILIGVAATSKATKPRCPSYSDTTWTRSGWYCTVPAAPRE